MADYYKAVYKNKTVAFYDIAADLMRITLSTEEVEKIYQMNRGLNG